MGETKRSYRIIFTLGAIALGILIVFLLSLAGGRTKGPVQRLLTSAAESILSLEDRMILNKRESRRARNLEWFEVYRTQKEKLTDPGVILLGASDARVKDSYESIIDLEDSLLTTFPLIHIYAAWGSGPDFDFPALQVRTILELGSLPVITWEPWLSAFNENEFPGIPEPADRDLGSLAAIAEGTYDSYIEKWAQEVRNVGEPIFIRFGHEMNDPYRYPWGPQNNKATDFVNAWIHVHDIFSKAGADNVLWIWSPHPSYGYFEYLYPGDEYVDYVGFGLLNFGTVANWSQWWSFDDILGKHYPALDSFKKPMMITEFGSLNVGGDRADWFHESFKNLPIRYPSIKSVIFFHQSEDRTVTNKVVSWQILRDPESLDAIRQEMRNWPDSLKAPRE